MSIDPADFRRDFFCHPAEKEQYEMNYPKATYFNGCGTVGQTAQPVCQYPQNHPCHDCPYKFPVSKPSCTMGSRRYYLEQAFYESAAAQDSFMERSGLTLRSPLALTHEELRVLVSCCARCVMLDNELDGRAENRINALMEKIESYLPPQQEVRPRHYFRDEPTNRLEE